MCFIFSHYFFAPGSYPSLFFPIWLINLYQERPTCAVVDGVVVILNSKPLESHFIEHSEAISCSNWTLVSIRGGFEDNFSTNYQQTNNIPSISHNCKTRTFFKAHNGINQKKTFWLTKHSKELPYLCWNMSLTSRNSGKSENLAAANIRDATASLHPSGHSLRKNQFKRGKNI